MDHAVGQTHVARPWRGSAVAAPASARRGSSWVRLAGSSPRVCRERTLSLRSAVAVVVGLFTVVVAGVVLVGTMTARQFAEQEVISASLDATDAVGNLMVQPALSDDLLSTDDEVAARAVRRFDAAFRARVPLGQVARMRLITPQGRIVYSDEAALIGQTVPLSAAQRSVLGAPVVRGEISDLSHAENSPRPDTGRLLEVYRRVATPNGTELLFDSFLRYDLVSVRSAELWHGIAGITLLSVLLLLLAQAPLGWVLLSRIRRAQRQRVALLDRAVSASELERRRIAATLHDGAVQELAASAFAVAGVADRARLSGDLLGAQRLDAVATTVRASISGLRSLLVDIYPPSLRASGLVAALNDLVALVRARELQAVLDVPEDPELPPQVEEVVFRVAQECLRNTLRHAQAHRVDVRLRVESGTPAEGDGGYPGVRAVLEVMDDGVGFDAVALIAAPEDGHFGLQLMADLAAGAGAVLEVQSVPGFGTRWRLEVPIP